MNTKEVTQEQAETIADAILSASGEMATRIALRQKHTHMRGSDSHSERDLGGLNRDALIRVISAATNAKQDAGDRT